MLHRLWLLLTSVIALASLPHHANASEINTTNYDIYIGDVNGDGLKDFFFKAKVFPVIVHRKISIPLMIARGVDFVIYRNGNNYKIPPELYTLYTPTVIATKLANGTLKKAVSGTDYETLTTSVQDQSKLLLKSTELGVWYLTLISSASSTLPTASVKEPSTTEPAAGSAQLAWRGIINGMVNNNPSSIAQYFDATVVTKYQQAFSMLGNQLADIGNQLGTLEPLYISDGRAVYLVTKKGDDGSNNVNTVTFLKDANGNWKVTEL